jgi:hypothetical protein
MGDLTFGRADTAARLRDSLRVIEWAAGLVPPEWTHANPAYYAPGAWTIAMNVAHLAVYEEQIANPLLAALADGADGVAAVKSAMENWILDASMVLAQEPFAAIVERMRAARETHVATVEQFAESRWNDRVTPLFATGVHGSPPHSAAWVANKTFQHTWEHGNAILRMALFAPR